MAEGDMKSRARPYRTVLHHEELEAAIGDLNDFADNEAQRIRNKNRGRVYRFSERKPNVDRLLQDTLRSALEDEIVPAFGQVDEQFRPIDFDQEVIKKALVGLRLDTLRKIARRKTVEVGGDLEEIATRIGRLYHWSREEIARLILENEPEPSEERAHIDRLFPLAEPPDLEHVVHRLEYVLGRYIRIGIARWFVFEHLEYEEDLVVLRGTVRAFSADVTEEAHLPSVIAVPRADHTVEIVLDHEKVLRVRRGNSFEASAAAHALSLVTQLRPLGFVPFATSGITQGPAVHLAPASLFMLDLVTARFGRVGLHDRNLTVARFRMDDREEMLDPEAAIRPRLHAVRFEGSHLLDSSPACKLLAEEGRALVDVSMTVEAAPRPDGERGRFPVRIGLERNHILAMTGYGLVPGLSFGVHAAVVNAVMEETIGGLADPDGLMVLALRIQERARSTSPVERADMLSDEPDSATSPG